MTLQIERVRFQNGNSTAEAHDSMKDSRWNVAVFRRRRSRRRISWSHLQTFWPNTVMHFFLSKSIVEDSVHYPNHISGIRAILQLLETYKDTSQNDHA